MGTFALGPKSEWLQSEDDLHDSPHAKVFLIISEQMLRTQRQLLAAPSCPIPDAEAADNLDEAMSAPMDTHAGHHNPDTVLHRHRRQRKGKLLLWQFLLQDLLSGHSDLSWLQDQAGNPGVFAFKDPNSVARRWGQYKGYDNMSYEKMSRCIRDYFTRRENRYLDVMLPDASGIADGIKRRRLHFSFNLRHPRVVQYIRQHATGYYHRLVDMKLVCRS